MLARLSLIALLSLTVLHAQAPQVLTSLELP
jgi:hypothetical protein